MLREPFSPINCSSVCLGFCAICGPEKTIRLGTSFPSHFKHSPFSTSLAFEKFLISVDDCFFIYSLQYVSSLMKVFVALSFFLVNSELLEGRSHIVFIILSPAFGTGLS